VRHLQSPLSNIAIKVKNARNDPQMTLQSGMPELRPSTGNSAGVLQSTRL